MEHGVVVLICSAGPCGFSSWNQASRIKTVEHLHYQFVKTAGPLVATVSQSDRIRPWFTAIV